MPRYSDTIQLSPTAIKAAPELRNFALKKLESRGITLPKKEELFELNKDVLRKEVNETKYGDPTHPDYVTNNLKALHNLGVLLQRLDKKVNGTTVGFTGVVGAVGPLINSSLGTIKTLRETLRYFGPDKVPTRIIGDEVSQELTQLLESTIKATADTKSENQAISELEYGIPDWIENSYPKLHALGVKVGIISADAEGSLSLRETIRKVVKYRTKLITEQSKGYEDYQKVEDSVKKLKDPLISGMEGLSDEEKITHINEVQIEALLELGDSLSNPLFEKHEFTFYISKEGSVTKREVKPSELKKNFDSSIKDLKDKLDSLRKNVDKSKKRAKPVEYVRTEDDHISEIKSLLSSENVPIKNIQKASMILDNLDEKTKKLKSKKETINKDINQSLEKVSELHKKKQTKLGELKIQHKITTEDNPESKLIENGNALEALDKGLSERSQSYVNRSDIIKFLPISLDKEQKGKVVDLFLEEVKDQRKMVEMLFYNKYFDKNEVQEKIKNFIDNLSGLSEINREIKEIEGSIKTEESQFEQVSNELDSHTKSLEGLVEARGVIEEAKQKIEQENKENELFKDINDIYRSAINLNKAIENAKKTENADLNQIEKLKNKLDKLIEKNNQTLERFDENSKNFQSNLETYHSISNLLAKSSQNIHDMNRKSAAKNQQTNQSEKNNQGSENSNRLSSFRK